MTERVLMCDDEVHILRAAEIKLTALGFKLECCRDGEEAWEALRREPAALLITDRQMPRLDGIGLIRRIRQTPALADMPIILLTSRGHDLPPAEDLGVLEIMDKPFSPRVLAQRVKSRLAPAAQ